MTTPMSDKEPKQQRDKTPKTREDRLKAALKANMAKRKAQMRARSSATDKKE